MLFLFAQGIVSEIFYNDGKIITQGYSWPGTARTSILIPIFIISAHKISLSLKKPFIFFLPCVVFSIVWCMYYDTKTGFILSLASFIYISLSMNLKKILIMSFFLIVSYLTSLFYAHKDQIFDKSTNIIVVKDNLKHMLIYISLKPRKGISKRTSWKLSQNKK